MTVQELYRRHVLHLMIDSGLHDVKQTDLAAMLSTKEKRVLPSTLSEILTGKRTGKRPIEILNSIELLAHERIARQAAA